MIIKNEKVYDVLKWIQRVAIPAIVACYLAIGVRLNWPDTENVAFIATTINTMLGVLLGIDQINYNKAMLELQKNATEEKAEDDQENGF